MISKIYYNKMKNNEKSKDLVMGLEWISQKNPLLLKKLKDHDLYETHKLLALNPELDLNKLYQYYQGEVWSPEGEAAELIQSLNLNHTSMTTGDIVQQDNKYYFCDLEGWKEI